MKKKLTPIILAIIMIFTMSSQSFAVTSNTETIAEPNLVKKVASVISKDFKYSDMTSIQKDLNEFNRLGFTLENISSIEKKGVSREYIFTDNPKAVIKVSEIDDAVKYIITEDTLTNEVIFHDNGDIYLDGEKIEISNTNDAPTVQPKAAGIVYMNTTKCPVGKATDYTKKVKSTSDANIALSKALGSINTSAVAAIIGKIVWQVGIAITAAQAIKSIVDATNNSSKYLSYKTTTYYHIKSNGGWIGGRLVTQYATNWYTKKNFGGKKVRKLTYRLGVTG